MKKIQPIDDNGDRVSGDESTLLDVSALSNNILDTIGSTVLSTFSATRLKTPTPTAPFPISNEPQPSTFSTTSKYAENTQVATPI